jgi:ferritin-like metal-binding protein YciE
MSTRDMLESSILDAHFNPKQLTEARRLLTIACEDDQLWEIFREIAVQRDKMKETLESLKTTVKSLGKSRRGEK